MWKACFKPTIPKLAFPALSLIAGIIVIITNTKLQGPALTIILSILIIPGFLLTTWLFRNQLMLCEEIIAQPQTAACSVVPGWMWGIIIILNILIWWVISGTADWAYHKIRHHHLT